MKTGVQGTRTRRRLIFFHGNMCVVSGRVSESPHSSRRIVGLGPPTQNTRPFLFYYIGIKIITTVSSQFPGNKRDDSLKIMCSKGVFITADL